MILVRNRYEKLENLVTAGPDLYYKNIGKQTRSSVIIFSKILQMINVITNFILNRLYIIFNKQYLKIYDLNGYYMI